MQPQAAGDAIDLPFPEIREVELSDPFDWLARGARDLLAIRGASLFYGFCFAAMGWLLMTVFSHAYQLTSALVCGFLLVGPFFALGLYDLSRQRESGEEPMLAHSLTAGHQNAGAIGVFAVILIIVFLIWARASLVIFALFYTAEMPTLNRFLEQVVSMQNLEFLMAYAVVGFVFASLVFGASVVAIPLMLDRRQDAVTAMLASLVALGRNPGPMLVWAVLIVSATLIGFMTFFLGLIVLMPLIGHATWHAYKALVVPLPGR
ncbi:DUF2189 domain-containing protein [Methyloversatilis thermotolerans]|uniref:DUF2189 domain-containing protein n=1 Tax=Methyloversatilis thermotolerans TaxID=1346290 RepID=UPI001E398F54|nr:DUF2189 domain-containing protein [Methyloversatilis thermotolerans]